MNLSLSYHICNREFFKGNMLLREGVQGQMFPLKGVCEIVPFCALISQFHFISFLVLQVAFARFRVLYSPGYQD